MKSLFASIFGRTPESPEQPLPDAPAAGQVYAFRTRPHSEFAPAQTERFAAFKVLGADIKHVTVAALDGVWRSKPTFRDVRRASLLHQNSFNWMGSPAVWGVVGDGWVPADSLDDLCFLGTAPLSATERSLADATARGDVGTRYSSLRAINFAVEGEWRWIHDRDALLAESEQVSRKREVEHAEREERYEKRLKNLTWDQLLAEVPFERWTPSPPYPPADFTQAARAEIRRACEALKALGPKPRKADARAILKSTVLWFNDADERAGGVIETEEREDIFAVLEEIAYVARHPGLIDEVDALRDW